MTLVTLGWMLILVPVAVFGYAFVLYPGLLFLFASFRRRPAPPELVDWPELTITLPVYNEEKVVARAIESLLAIDYPRELLHILVISDASTDRTDAIVESYADRGVGLLRLPNRSGKTQAENAAAPRLRGSIVVNTDATTLIPPQSLKALVRAFGDPSVGVSSGRDVSQVIPESDSNAGESGYVGFEMWLRRLETRLGTIVGASGCFYAVRRDFHDTLFPVALSRDFACTLMARRRGFRSVSADAAVCIVPRTRSLQGEFRRKSRTMARGLETLWYLRGLLNPLRYGLFSWMLFSHKLVRWLLFACMPLMPLGCLLLLGTDQWWVGGLGLVATAVTAGLGWFGFNHPDRRLPLPLGKVCYVSLAIGAGLSAWARALRGELNPIWEPTRR